MMDAPSIAATRYDLPTSDEPLAVLAIGDVPVTDSLETARGRSSIEVTTVSSLSSALDRVDEVDCLVCRWPLENGAPQAVIGRVRRRHAGMPILVVTDESRLTTVRDATVDHRWVDVVADGVELPVRLRHRIPRLVERKQLSALSNRSLAAIELAGDAIATVDPHGALEFPNRSFAVEFGADRDGLIGRPWQELFTSKTADRLETTTIPTVEDGWRWTGTCTGRRVDDTEFQTRVSIDGLEDGSLVFVVEASTDEATLV